MAQDVNTLVLQMSADVRRFEKAMDSMRATADRRLNEVERRATQSQKNLTRIMDSAGRDMTSALRTSLTALAPTLAAAFSTQQVIKYADAYTSLQNRLKATGLEGMALQRVEDRLYETANRNGVAVAATAELYQRATMARQNLGASEEKLLDFVSGTSAALKVQGTSATEASGALLQLGQLLGGNVVQAQEYNSLIDQTPVLLQAVANGSDRFGGSINNLTKLVKDGKVSSKEFFDAALVGFKSIEQQANSAVPTVSAALQTLDNQLGRYVGQTESGLSATQRMAQGIILLSDNLDTVTIIVGGLATIIGGRYLLSLTASATATVAATAESVRYQLALASLEARQLGVSRATVLATGATRTFTAAIAANPLGAALVATAALAAGIYLLNQRFSEGARAAREFEAMTTAGSKALAEYEKAQIKAKNASKESAAYARENAKAMREEAQAAIVAARALAAKRTQEAQTRLAAATAAVEEVNSGRPREMGEALGQAAYAAGAIREAQRAQAQAAEAIREQWRQEDEFARIAAGINLGGDGGSTTATEDGKKKKGASGPTPEELARQRQLLDLQMQIERLRAQGQDDAARAKQRELDTLNLTKQLQDAGVQDAKARAEAQVAAIAVAEDAQRGLQILWDRNQEVLEKQEAANERANDLLLDRLGYEAELARLAGHEGRIRTAERELFIASRVNELLERRIELSRDSAQARAEREWAALDSADSEGALRDEFRRSFSEGIRAAIDGDLGGFFENLADRFTDRMLDNLADDLFDLLAGAAKGFGQSGGGGTGWMSAIAGLFAGKRASGGAVVRGQAYITGERRPEVFVPNTSGTIIPSVNAAMNRAQHAHAARQQPVIVQLAVEEGGLFVPRVQAISGSVAVQTTTMGVATVQDQQRTANMRRRQSLVG